MNGQPGMILSLVLSVILSLGTIANIGGAIALKGQWDQICDHFISHALVNLITADLLYLFVLMILLTEQVNRQYLHSALCK